MRHVRVYMYNAYSSYSSTYKTDGIEITEDDKSSMGYKVYFGIFPKGKVGSGVYGAPASDHVQ